MWPFLRFLQTPHYPFSLPLPYQNPAGVVMPSPSTRLRAEQGGEKLTPWKDPAGVKRPRFITQPEGSIWGLLGAHCILFQPPSWILSTRRLTKFPSNAERNQKRHLSKVARCGTIPAASKFVFSEEKYKNVSDKCSFATKQAFQPGEFLF